MSNVVPVGSYFSRGNGMLYTCLNSCGESVPLVYTYENLEKNFSTLSTYKVLEVFSVHSLYSYVTGVFLSFVVYLVHARKVCDIRSLSMRGPGKYASFTIYPRVGQESMWHSQFFLMQIIRVCVPRSFSSYS